MGIRGLESYIERELPTVLEDVNIIECAQEYSKRKKCDPVLIINGSSLIRERYKTFGTSSTHLILMDKLGKEFQRLIEEYTKHNIQCVAYFQGSPVYKEERWVTERKNEVIDLSGVIHMIKSGRHQEAYNSLIRNAVDVELIKVFLRCLKCEVKQFEDDANKSLLQLISNYECFGLLGKDTDFIILEGVENYFSAKHLDQSGLITKVFNRKKLANSLGFEERFLPLFASLCGNNYVTDDDLRKFHLFLLRDRPNIRRLRSASFLPKQVLIPKVGQWLGQNCQKLSNAKDTPRIVAEMIRAPNLEGKFLESFSCYSISFGHPKFEAVEPDSSEWAEILQAAKTRLSKKGIHRGIFNVLIHNKHFMKHNFEAVTGEWPDSSECVGDLLKRVYGVLLKERPLSLGPPIVQLYHYKKGAEFSPSEITPSIPLDHPGLKCLWGNCPIEEKLSLFWWIVTGTSDPNSILLIPEDLRLTSAALYFIVNEAKYKLKRCEVETLIKQAVCLSLGLKLPQYEVCQLTVLELHVANFYLSAFNCVVMADDVCGNPLQVKEKTVIFDGELFNKLFNVMEDSSFLPEVCKTPLYKTLLDFIYGL